MEYRYSCTLYLTSALDGMGGQHDAPAVLPPVKGRYALYRGLGGPQRRSGQMRKISPLTRFDPRTVQPSASRYNVWAIPAHLYLVTGLRMSGALLLIFLWLRISVFGLGVMGKICLTFRKELSPSWSHRCHDLHRWFTRKWRRRSTLKFC